MGKDCIAFFRRKGQAQPATGRVYYFYDFQRLRLKRIKPQEPGEVTLKRVCVSCGNPFYGASHARYCSDACKQKEYRQRKNRKQDTQDETGARICAYCGKAFTGALYGRYCSDAHKKAAYRERKKRKQEIDTNR